MHRCQLVAHDVNKFCRLNQNGFDGEISSIVGNILAIHWNYIQRTKIHMALSILRALSDRGRIGSFIEIGVCVCVDYGIFLRV